MTAETKGGDPLADLLLLAKAIDPEKGNAAGLFHGKGGIAFVRNYLTLDLYGAGLDLYVVGLPDDAADLEVLESDPEAGTSTVRVTFHASGRFTLYAGDGGRQRRSGADRGRGVP